MKITIAAIEKQPPKQEGWAETYKIKTSSGEICYANVGQWNANWGVGQEVEADKKDVPGKKYFALKCPPELNPKSAPSVNTEPIMEALRMLYKLVKGVGEKVDILIKTNDAAKREDAFSMPSDANEDLEF